jgi:hypothetical protein
MKNSFLLGGIFLVLFLSGLNLIQRPLAFSPPSGPLATHYQSIPSAAARPGGSTVSGVFVASSPCGAAIRPVLGIPAHADCELIKWQLTLYWDRQTKRPATYHLKWAYGLAQPNTTGHVGGGTKRERTGNWNIGKGTSADPAAVVYRLDPEKPATTISLLKLDDRLLHVLDGEKALMIGDGAWSYTLNRTGN